jgi:tetratricopeptide (TPR) repeat protein
MKSSEQKRDQDVEAAGAAATSDERERLRAAAEKANSVRKARIDDLVDSFVALNNKLETTAVFREMTRILSEEGVEATLAYVDKQRASVLERIRARADALHAQNRADLQPLLKAAGLRAAKGQPDQARADYRSIVALEPAWPEALQTFGWFLVDQSVQSKVHGTISVAHADAVEALGVAKSLLALDGTPAQSRRLYSASLDEYGDVLSLRAQPGDGDLALKMYHQSREIREGLLKEAPGNGVATRDVAIGLNKVGDFLVNRGQKGDADQGLALYTRSLELSEALLKVNPDSAEVTRDVSITLNKLGDFLVIRAQKGDTDKALEYYTRGLDLISGLAKAADASGEAQRDVFVSLSKLGNFVTVRGREGDSDRAFDFYSRGLQIAEGLFKAQPGSNQAARDVSVGLERLADFHFGRGQAGDPDLALGYFTRCLEIRETLLKTNADSAACARDVAVVLNKLGDFRAARGLPGDAEQAGQDYTRALGYSEGLLKANPDSAQPSRDVCICLERLGNFLLARGRPGDAEEAFGNYSRNLSICEELLADNPDSALAKRDVTVSLNKVADFLVLRGQPGDAEKALEHNLRSLRIRQELREADPGSGVAVRDVSIALERLGDFYLGRRQPGDQDEALGNLTQCLEIREVLLKANPGSALASRDVSVVLNKLGDLLTGRGGPGDGDLAYGYLSRSLKIAEDLQAADPGSARVGRDLSVSLNQLGNFLVARRQPGDLDQALVYYNRSLTICDNRLKVSPDSGRAQRYVFVTLNRLSLALAARARPEDDALMLACDTRSLKITGDLMQANPNSAQAIRDVVISLNKLAAYYSTHGRPDEAQQSSARAQELYARLEPAPAPAASPPPA